MTGEVVPEAVVARLRPHARALFWPTVALLALVAATAYFAGSFPEDWQNWTVLGASAVLVLLLFFAPLLAWLGRSYTITTRRIVLRHGLLVRTRQELLHSRGYDVTVRQNGLQQVFRSGDVLINTGLDHPIVLRDIPAADLVQSALHELMERSLNPIAARRQQEQSRPPDETTSWGTR
ncbi:MAG TPA: PH domain-containing protein [Solirubrobacteraceae bacterium]|nr:PH domain-containing protein [Solirubrobacteraceae bacterium]